jgi:HSP20 family protein
MSIKDLVPGFCRRDERMPIRRKEEDGLLSFQREMNRLFDDFFHGFGLGPTFDWGDRSLAKATFSPKVDVSETKKEVKVSAELPGMEEKDIAVELGDNVLTIRGEKKEEHEDNGKDWYRKEQTYGSFHRVIPLPSAVDGECAKARFKRGKLVVRIPKKGEVCTGRQSIRIDSD